MLFFLFFSWEGQVAMVAFSERLKGCGVPLPPELFIDKYKLFLDLIVIACSYLEMPLSQLHLDNGIQKFIYFSD